MPAAIRRKRISSNAEMPEQVIDLQQWDGANDGWRGRLPLRSLPANQVVIDAGSIRFATPTFLLRLRSFVEWHLADGRSVTVRCPRNRHVANYMARMHLGAGLPAGVFVDLPTIREKDQSEVLIPVTQLRTPEDVDRFNEVVSPLVQAHARDVALLESALAMAISELCGNAVEHGENPLGCYVAAQRYPTKRTTVLAIGDLGCGIPTRIREHFDHVRTDPTALEFALREGVTTTGRTSRGLGFYWVMDAAQHSHIRSASLDVRAGKGHLTRTLDLRGQFRTTTQDAPHKLGTWVTLELGPKA